MGHHFFNYKKRYTSAAMFIAGIVGAAGSQAVYAHAQFTLDSATPPRYNEDGIKNVEACGTDASYGNLRTNRKGIFVAGETITVEWVETVNHPGSYWFDFSPANDQNFVEVIPPVPDTLTTPTPHSYSQAIQLNFAPCSACTLRMRQKMSDDMTVQDFYYSCADIVIVSGSDVTPPLEVSAANASLLTNGVQLTWNNPGDTYGVIVLRDTAPISSQPATRQDYLNGDNIGNARVVYKGTASGFTDTNVAASTEYTYKIFAFDADYNYNGGVEQTIVTAADTNSGGGGGGGSNGDNNGGGQAADDTGGGGGLGSWVFILLATVLIYRRPSWRKLL